MEARRLCASEEMIRSKEIKIIRRVKEQLPLGKQMSLKFLTVWLHHFKLGRKFKRNKTREKKGGTDTQTVGTQIPVIR